MDWVVAAGTIAIAAIVVILLLRRRRHRGDAETQLPNEARNFEAGQRKE
jgi:hypothetical protein